MKFSLNDRHALSLVIIVFYFIPLFFFSSYSIRLMSLQKSWTVLCLGLLLISIGGLGLISWLNYWEHAIRNQLKKETFGDEQETKVTTLDSSFLKNESIFQENKSKETKELSLLQTSLMEERTQQTRLLEELNQKKQEILKSEENQHQLNLKCEKISQAFSDYKIFSEEQLKQKSLQLQELQKSLDEIQNEIEKKDQLILKQENKIQDLSYEMKTLLSVQEESHPKYSFPTHTKQAFSFSQEPLIPNEKPIQTETEAYHLLQRCVSHALKITSSPYFGDFAKHEFSQSPIDQRRFFDLLRQETGGIILLYSPKENKILFCHPIVKQLLGWTPEKFMQDFFSIIQGGFNEWKQAMGLLQHSSESKARILLKTKNGEEHLFECHLGSINNGIFKFNVINVLYPLST